MLKSNVILAILAIAGRYISIKLFRHHTATMTIVKNLIIVALFATLSACANNSSYVFDKYLDFSPIKSKTKLTSALQCISDQLQLAKPRAPNTFVFMVRNINGGITGDRHYSDEQLSDAGRMQLINILSAHTKPAFGVVLDEYPPIFKATRDESTLDKQSGLDRYSMPSPANMNEFITRLTRFSNNNRAANGLPAVNSVMPLSIDGTFTRYDNSSAHAKGDERDAEGAQSASVDFGKSGSKRSLTLVVNVVDARNNAVIGTEGFDLKFYSNSKIARFRVAIDEYYYGFSNQAVKVESVHAAQQILLEASAIWILDNAYGDMVDFAPCLDTQKTRQKTWALGTDASFEAAQAAAFSDQNDAQDAQNTGIDVNSLGLSVSPDLILPQAAVTLPMQAATAEVAEVSAVAKPTWRVVAGLFCKPNNVATLSAKLKSHGYTVHTDSRKIATCQATRVSVGPYNNRAAAEKVRVELKTFTGEKGLLME